MDTHTLGDPLVGSDNEGQVRDARLSLLSRPRARSRSIFSDLPSPPPPSRPTPAQAYTTNPLLAVGGLPAYDPVQTSDVEAHSTPSQTPPPLTPHAPATRLAAMAVLAHAATFWVLFLGPGRREGDVR